MLVEILDCERPVGGGAGSGRLEEFSSGEGVVRALIISGVILKILLTRMLTPVLVQLSGPQHT